VDGTGSGLCAVAGFGISGVQLYVLNPAQLPVLVYVIIWRIQLMHNSNLMFL